MNDMGQVTAMTDDERLDLARWALLGGVVWLGLMMRGTPRPALAKYVAIIPTTAYGGTGVLEETAHEDPWECLRLARRALLECEPKESSNG